MISCVNFSEEAITFEDGLSLILIFLLVIIFGLKNFILWRSSSIVTYESSFSLLFSVIFVSVPTLGNFKFLREDRILLPSKFFEDCVELCSEVW